ncbi:uncharacterized protein VTP21DRAFT_9283 [Calcarisporiella thermophila]|uniref:uncharacterized protein n=1 Tax=Calcarisporiella thermophila TaxID=911321 RepID=UPI00374276A2
MASTGSEGGPKTKKPANTAFKQQRLRAWQPLLTPKAVLPTLFIVGIIFAPIGGLLLYGSSTVAALTIDYTNCMDSIGNFQPISSYSFRRSFFASDLPEPPQYMGTPDQPPLSPKFPPNLKVSRCTIDFVLPADIKAPVFLYYRLSNFYQNHRRYVKSIDLNQLKGDPVPVTTLEKTCVQVAKSPDNKPYYPCGLIANSMFNDTIGDFTLAPQTSIQSNTTYRFSSKNIAWPSDIRRYGNTGYSPDACVPPPNWSLRYPGGVYSSAFPPPNITEDEHFIVWIRTAPFPTFRKLYGRNDAEDMVAGRYRVQIDMNYDVRKYGATKSIVIASVNVLGGRNIFIGFAYLAVGIICVVLGLLLTVRHCIKPRKLGDHAQLAWKGTPTVPVQLVAPEERSKSWFKR